MTIGALASAELRLVVLFDKLLNLLPQDGRANPSPLLLSDEQSMMGKSIVSLRVYAQCRELGHAGLILRTLAVGPGPQEPATYKRHITDRSLLVRHTSGSSVKLKACYTGTGPVVFKRYHWHR